LVLTMLLSIGAATDSASASPSRFKSANATPMITIPVGTNAIGFHARWIYRWPDRYDALRRLRARGADFCSGRRWDWYQRVVEGWNKHALRYTAHVWAKLPPDQQATAIFSTGMDFPWCGKGAPPRSGSTVDDVHGGPGPGLGNGGGCAAAPNIGASCVIVAVTDAPS
jgi:hypothetical protein